MTTAYTIGHSTRSTEEFVAVLAQFGVENVADVRSVPHSAHNPQFDLQTLPHALSESGIAYTHHPRLGGFRHPTGDSANDGWRNERFRAYADYMQTAQFEEALEALAEEARRLPTALMCAEAVPWRCHRSLIGDALLVRGFEVVDIISADSAKPHLLTPFAKVDGTTITYPAPREEAARAGGQVAAPSAQK